MKKLKTLVKQFKTKQNQIYTKCIINKIRTIIIVQKCLKL